MTEPIKPWKQRIDYTEPPTIKRMSDAKDEEIAELRAALAAKGEPVAWVVALPNKPITITVPVAMLDKLAGMHDAPLYTRPAPREPMTDAGIWQLATQCTIGGDLHADKFAREIEAFHGIGIKEKSE